MMRRKGATWEDTLSSRGLRAGMRHAIGSRCYGTLGVGRVIHPIILICMSCNPSQLLASGVTDVPPSDVTTKQAAKYVENRKNCTGSWDSKFERSLTGNTFLIKIKIFLDKQTGVTDVALAAKKAAWKTEIEARWSGIAQFECKIPGQQVVKPIPINVQVEFVAAAAGAHYTVKVMPGNVRARLQEWYIEQGAGTAAHEVGHMIGAFDDYKDGEGFRTPCAIDKGPGGPTEAATDKNSIMGNLNGKVLERHLEHPLSVIRASFPKTYTFKTKLNPGPPCPPPAPTCDDPPEGTTGCDDDPPFVSPADGGPGPVDGFVCVCEGDGTIPAVSEWGLIVMTLIGLAMGTVFYGRRRLARA